MRKVILGYGNGSGATWWRMGMGFKWIMRQTPHVALLSPRGIVDEDLAKSDVIVLKGTVDKMGIASILAARELSGNKKKLVVDVDDALFVKADNPAAKKWEVTDAAFVISQTIKAADSVTCSTPALAEKLRELNGNTHVIPNCYDPDWFDVPYRPNTDGTVRIGWAGSITHMEDFTFIAPVLNHLMKKYPKVKMVICGDTRLAKMIDDQSRVEVHNYTPVEVWPMKLASMSLDIGIAPLVDNEFNRYKSNIKWMEYSLCKIASVTSKIVYEDSLRACETPKEWETTLSELIESPSLRYSLALQAHSMVQKKYNIASHYPLYLKAYGIR